MDLVFVVDTSRSSTRRWLRVLRFISEVVRNFKIGPGYTRVGLVGFSSFRHSGVEFNLKQYNSASGVQRHIRALKHKSYGNYVARGLQLVRSSVLTVSAGDRRNVKNVVVVVTNDKSSQLSRAVRESKLLQRSSRAFIIGVAVGDARKTRAIVPQLQRLVTRPWKSNVVKARFLSLVKLVKSLATKVCGGVLNVIDETIFQCTRKHKNIFYVA